MQILTREQAAVIGAYTGISCGPFKDIHALAEKKLGRPIFTHEFGNKALWEELKSAVRQDFIDIAAEDDGVEHDD